MRVEGTPDRLIPVGLPKYLFAIRGTIPSRSNDISSDIKIVGEVLHVKDALPVTRLLLAITRKYNPHDVWVAGHSLGAALALIATRFLAIDHDVVINPHLFNPPYLTVGRLASKAMRGVLNGVGDTGNRLLDTLGMTNILNIRAGTDRVYSVYENMSGTLSRKGSQIAKSSNAENMKRDSQKLLQIGYVPHLYVNPNDTICNEYIKHFQRRHHVHNSFSSEVMQSVVPARSLHMIPSAALYINNWAEGFPEAHKLHQWFRYRHVNLTVERKRLTADQISIAPSDSIGSLQAQDSRRSRA